MKNNKFKVANAVLVAALALALSGCGDDVEVEGPIIPPPVLPPADGGTDGAALGIFDNAASEGWAVYNSSDAGLAAIVTDGDYGDVVQFTIADNGETVAGMTARTTADGHNAIDGSPYDASAIVDTGTFEFDLKIVSTTTTESAARAEMVPWSIKFEDANGNFAEVPFKILPSTDWQHFRFTLAEIAATLPPEWSDTDQVDLSLIDLMLMYPNWQTAGGLVYVVDNVAIYANAEPVVDTEAPVITLLGDATINLTNGTAFVDPGYNVSDNVDADITVTVGGDTVDTGADGAYVITYNATDAAGNEAVEVTRTINVSSVDEIAPVITLNGGSTISFVIGSTYVDPGATAADNVDGDVTADIIVDDSTVDTSTLGSYQVTYNVVDAAGNDAAEVTRTVNVIEAASTIVVNGDFESALGAEWELQEGEGTTTIVDGELVVEGISPGAAYQPRLVQGDIVVTPDVTYAIRFDAMVAEDRSINIQLGELLSGAPWFNPFMNDQAVALTTSMESYEVLFTASANAANSGDLIFALGAGVSTTFTLDNVSISEITAAEIAPVITLLGDSAVSLTVGDSYTDAGVTANDNLDGDLSASVVTVNPVDTSIVGVYTITYNLSDSDGNDAKQVTRTVTVEEESTGGTNWVLNGDFATMAAWDGAFALVDGAANITINGGESRIKQTAIGAGVVTGGQQLTLSFDVKGTSADGAIFNGIIHTIGNGVTATDIVESFVPTATWQTITHDFTAGGVATGGIDLTLGPVCGAVAGCQMDVYIDNVTIGPK
ncbi:DUF5011 domain-containing protein [Agarivorans sp. TSD2052]|uniref:immunoglobulin-like domain-containing protein n=1 Tax=Agarivorans sp. TSD2052 TaxID=2937286 RepID=UPI00200CED3C|nr:immunoglobulin-like domain-containing protein [Agarivorans sp. TSD2052]UPW19543.1 DUF5011 domain-containing protein [Agarivorans sp. TSD2052]